FYKYDVAGVANPDGAGRAVVRLGNGPSINDSGAIAYAGYLAQGGGGLFINEPSNSIMRNINPAWTGIATYLFGPVVQITNDKWIVSQLVWTQTEPPFYYLRRWDASKEDEQTKLAQGSGSGDFDRIFAHASMNNLLLPVFSAI